MRASGRPAGLCSRPGRPQLSRGAMGSTTATSILGTAVTLCLVACTGRPPEPQPTAPVAAECELLAWPGQSADTVLWALEFSVDPGNAPRPRNGSERQVFAHLYETLIEVDCEGEVRPALAGSWRSKEGGRIWTLTLRREARFWDGSPVSAADAVASWANAATASPAGIDSALIVDERTVEIHLRRRHREVPRMLADPAYAVARRSDGNGWALGSGPHRVESQSGSASGESFDRIFVLPTDDGTPVIEFRTIAGRDTRDVFESGIDVLVTRDPAVIDYAGTLSAFDDVALAWDKTHVLLATSRVRELRRDGYVGDLAEMGLDALARDAVRSDARGHGPPSWWSDLASCPASIDVLAGLPPLPRGAYGGSDRRVIAYPSEDPTARELAERLVALAAARPVDQHQPEALAAAVPNLVGVPGELVAEGLDTERFAKSLREGDDFAYVVALPRQALDGCGAARRLLQQAEWLAQEGVALADAILPLVDTRRHAIVRAGSVGLTASWDGTITVSRPGFTGGRTR